MSRLLRVVNFNHSKWLLHTNLRVLSLRTSSCLGGFQLACKSTIGSWQMDAAAADMKIESGKAGSGSDKTLQPSGPPSDAPGWGGEDGPVCWKCQGAGHKRIVKQSQEPVTCPVCRGVGRLPKKKLRVNKGSGETRAIQKEWVIPGPKWSNTLVEIDERTEQNCALLGHWRIIQSHRGGHRWSTDDLLTAWVACTEASASHSVLKTHLDLGCGIGTVLLMTSWFFYDQKPKGVGVEAQSVSADKARRNIRLNGVDDRLTVINRDFRDCDEDVKNVSPEGFDLVTGTPPYFPVKFDKETGVARPGYGGMPTFQQSAPARFEFRGGIEDYLLTATKFVSRSQGVVVVCEGNIAAAPKELVRIEAASKASRLKLIRTVFVHGREDKPPLFAVHVLLPEESSKAQRREFVREKFDVRHLGGKRTEMYLSMCQTMGIAPFNEDFGGDGAHKTDSKSASSSSSSSLQPIVELKDSKKHKLDEREGRKD